MERKSKLRMEEFEKEEKRCGEGGLTEIEPPKGFLRAPLIYSSNGSKNWMIFFSSSFVVEILFY